MPNSKIMFITVHAASGIIIGQYIGNPWLAFLIGFISHIILDIIPHGDTQVAEKYKNPIHIGAAALLDFIILFFLLVFLLVVKIDLFQPSIIMGMIGAMLLDIFQGIYYLTRNKTFKKLQNFHHLFHNAISQKHELNFFVGLALQIVLLIIFTTIIIL